MIATRILFIISLLFLGFPAVSHADTVYLKDGKVIEGDIVEDHPRYIMLDDGGDFPRRYYRELIEWIDEADEAPEDVDIELPDLPSGDFGNIPQSKAKLILGLLSVNGTREIMEKNKEEVLETLPVEQQEDLNILIDIDELISRMVPVYAKQFSESEIKAMYLFYDSPAGRKSRQQAPEILQQTMKESLKYFKEKLNP